MSLDASKRILHLAVALALVLGPSFIARGAENGPRTLSTPPAPGEAQLAVEKPDFGTISCDVISLSAYDFEPSRKAGYVTGVDDDGNGYSWATGGSNMLFIASVQVPAGVKIEYIGVRLCDTAPASSFTGVLNDVRQNGTTVQIVSVTFPDTGCTTMFNPTDLGYDWDFNSTHSLDVYLFQQGPDVGGQVKFRGAEVWYTRKVSPAPANPSFIDVPITDPAFQFIEAFWKAGITVGCQAPGDPLMYCPDANVTRREMAVFIAKALGLHFAS
jgi:hypothetical protein